MKEFSKVLIELRKESKISQQKLAHSIGVTQQCISEWEKGNMEPTLSNLIKLADFFEISIDFLAGRTEY
ncbi:MAG: helix-turn-helix transcriptional regulator [Clostridia bacterium]|nr:helix-turn-helix transcriptional regulator [Clostridia bacterium]